MKTFIPKKPVGDSPLWTWRRWIWDLLAGGYFPLKGDGNIIVQFQQGVYRISSKPYPTGGAGGWDWMYPTHKELDPSLSYSAGKWAYISELNPLVTAGMTDIVSNATVVSCYGYWQCVRDVPAAVGGKFNVPAFPYASGLGVSAPSGSPLMGDLDALDGSGQPAIYWAYFGYPG